MKKIGPEANALVLEFGAGTGAGRPKGEITIDRKQLVSYDTTEIWFTIPSQ